MSTATSNRGISPTHIVYLCINFFVPLFFILRIYVKAKEMLEISKREMKDSGCGMEKSKRVREMVLSHQAAKEMYLALA